MVEIKLRTLGTETAYVDVDMDLSINDLKSAIENKLGSDFYLAKHQILILGGQNITNFEEKLAALEMKSSDSIIVIGYKHHEPIPEPIKAQNDVKSSPLNKNGAQVKFTPDPKAVETLTEFGFDQKDIMRALGQTNDVEVATELILNGMKNSTDFTNVGADSEVSKDEKSQTYNQIKEILESVDIPSLIERSRETDQTVLESLCHELLTSNPDGMKLLMQDHETFSKVYSDILNSMNVSDQDVEFGDDTNILEAFGADADMADMEDAMNIDSVDDVQTIEAELTENDQIIIENLSQLGYTKEQCTIAYLACNKDPEHAAQFLLENQDNDDQ